MGFLSPPSGFLCGTEGFETHPRMPAGGRQVACKNALDKAISNALNAVDDLAVTGAAGLSPKGTGPVSPKGAGTGSPRAQGSRKGRETDAAEDMSAMGLSVQRISTAKAAESSSDTAEMAAEPPEQDQHEGRGSQQKDSASEVMAHMNQLELYL